VDYITQDGVIVLENGWRLDEKFKHFEYGWTLTSHAAQGRTLDRVFIAQSEMSRGASDMKQFLVSISRGSKGVKIYTDDIELLRDYVSRERESLMASELFRTGPEVMTPDVTRTSAELGMLERVSMEIGAIAPDEVASMQEKASTSLGTMQELEQLEPSLKPETELEYTPEHKSPMKEELELEIEL